MSVNYVRAIPITYINSADLAGDFAVVNAGLPEACFLLRIINDSNIDVDVSYDGAVMHDYVTAGSHLDINAQANATPDGYVALFRKGLPVYVRAQGGAGYIYVVGYYA